MAKQDEILQGINDIKVTQAQHGEKITALKDRLYDQDGDIPDIKMKLVDLNGTTRNQEGRILTLETVEKTKTWTKKKIAGGTGGGSFIIAIIYGAGKLAGWW